jgi:peroxiredoxin Q/BCP
VKIGGSAPEFALPDQNGATVRLLDFRGKKSIVLAFYIKAGTSG